jgi:hypothetical protein
MPKRPTKSKPTPASPREIVMPEGREDPTPVILDEDQERVYKKSIDHLVMAIGWLQDTKKAGDLTASVRATAMTSLEMYVADLGKCLGYQTDIERRREADVANLRSANRTIRELESQIGAAMPPDALKLGIARLKDRFDEVWRGLGFCLVDVKPGSCVISATFTIMLDSHPSTFSEKPVTERRDKMARVADKADSGLEIAASRSNGEPTVLDTPGNRAWIVARLREHFPSLKPFKWESLTNDRRGDSMALRHLEATVEYADLVDVANGQPA